jgi:hypothetical protein
VFCGGVLVVNELKEGNRCRYCRPIPAPRRPSLSGGPTDDTYSAESEAGAAVGVTEELLPPPPNFSSAGLLCPAGFEALPPYAVDEGEDARLAAAIEAIQMQEGIELAARRSGPASAGKQSVLEQEEWVASTYVVVPRRSCRHQRCTCSTHPLLFRSPFRVLQCPRPDIEGAGSDGVGAWERARRLGAIRGNFEFATSKRSRPTGVVLRALRANRAATTSSRERLPESCSGSHR